MIYKSMAERKKAEERNWFIGWTVVVVIIFALYHLNLFHTDAGRFTDRAGGWSRFFSVIFFAVSIGWVWGMSKWKVIGTDKIHPGILCFAFLVLAICLATGFNFDYFGL